MSGSAVISALAVLENPRLEGNKGRNVLFDGHLYFDDDPSSSNRAALVLLRYFNDANIIFSDMGRYFIQANVCDFTHTVIHQCTDMLLQISIMDSRIASDSLTDTMELSDYVLTGDIIQVCTSFVTNCSND